MTDKQNEQTEEQELAWCRIEPATVSEYPDPGSRSRLLRGWALVLDSRSIPCCLENDESGLQLSVPPQFFRQACDELRRYEEANRLWPPPFSSLRQVTGNTLSTLSVLILLATFHNITQIESPVTGIQMPDWMQSGAASAGRIHDGEWWRLITALTLHADWRHLAGNLAIGGIFTLFLCRELGSGLAWSLLLGAGILGNHVNALVQPASHSSIGASTAVFGGIGLLAAVTLVRKKDCSTARLLLPFAGGLALLAFLGTEGKNTDIGAHLFGFLSGGCLGLITEYLIGRHGRPGWLLNVVLAGSSAAAVLSAWWAALHN